eukprot:TRINITY_DN19545_c0_g1_i1.p1 TRINITY_DN19545_c0_g1~~TRINITY_DN19545_c0_g1_i1.p1  ORF type:complete len:1339 (+),score=298.21 TRINITY_DN19545_c0_g1_i1:54-4070(+)
MASTMDGPKLSGIKAPPIDGDVPPVEPATPKVSAGQRTAIVTEDGTKYYLDELALPQHAQHTLAELDFDGTGNIWEHELHSAGHLLRELKRAMDTSGDGKVSTEELEGGVSLLSRLMQQKVSNSSEMEYLHLPEGIQSVMKEWDTDATGKVSQSELAAAAQAFKRIQQEGRMMKKIIFGLAVVILILMAGMFVLSYLAVDMAKEMRGSSDGVMESSTGTVVKVGSSDFEMTPDGSLIIRGTGGQNASCPEGKTCRRLGENGAGSLKVASAEAKRQLSSTLPDTAFKELKSLTLKDSSDRVLAVTITSFQRLKLRSSKCGSVVHLKSAEGTLTLDDYEMTADAAMEAYVTASGMEGLFDGPVKGFGRKLSSTDGMLEGFFNLLEDVEWECESVQLPSPEDMPLYYRAKVHVRHRHEVPSLAFSSLFTDATGGSLLLPGVVVEKEGGPAYKTWTEDIVRAKPGNAFLSEFVAFPLTHQLRVQANGFEMKMDVQKGTGYRCKVEKYKKLPGHGESSPDSPRMEFVGVVVEKGIVLRHWRLVTVDIESDDKHADDKDGDDEDGDDTGGDTESEDDDEEQKPPSQQEVMKNMAIAGMIPNVMDYYDVDSDPSEKRTPGQPYRLQLYSTVEGSKVFTEKTYDAMEPLAGNESLKELLELYNVHRLEEACKVVKADENSTDAQAFASEFDVFPLVDQSVRSPTFKPPPEVNPWVEMVSAVDYNFHKLSHMHKHDPKAPELKLAETSPYWSAALQYSGNWDVIKEYDNMKYVPTDCSDDELLALEKIKSETENGTFNGSSACEALVPLDLCNDTWVHYICCSTCSKAFGDSRRLAAADDEHAHGRGGAGRRLGTRSDSEVIPGERKGEYRVRIANSGKREPAGVVPRRLQHLVEDEASWRPRRLGTKFDFEAEVTLEHIKVAMTAGKVDFELIVNYCNLVAPTKTSWGACLTGRADAGGIIKGEAYAGGKQFLFPWPKVTLTAAGGLVYDNTAPMTCEEGKKVRLVSRSARGRKFSQSGSMSTGTGNDETFSLHTNRRRFDGKYYIKSESTSKHLQDNRGKIRSSWNKGGWERFHILDAQDGRVFIQSHRGQRLGVKGGGSMVGGKCTVTLYRGSNCKGSHRRRSTKSYSSTNTRDGQIFKFGDDDWESARASGDCAKVEFFDEDEGESGYEDNQWKHGTFGCFDFKSDLDSDMNGLRIWSKEKAGNDWSGSSQFSWGKGDDERWEIVKVDGTPACTASDFKLYGVVQFKKEMDIIFDYSASFTTEIGAATSKNEKCTYISEVYGKGIIEFGPVLMYGLLSFSPVDACEKKYKEWGMCLSVGYEVELGITTVRDDYPIHCQDLNFR